VNKVYRFDGCFLLILDVSGQLITNDDIMPDEMGSYFVILWR
jgi:hypothetical protein